MSIANELSSDVAAAMLARKNDATPQDASELARVVIEVHATLRRMTLDARRKRLHPQAAHAEEAPRSNSAASGN